MDPWEMGAILEAGGVGGPCLLGGGKDGQLASDSGGGYTSQNGSEARRQARHNTKPHLCTEYVSLCIVC